ncbi:hypothetical protein [Pectobacterium carotovorum]|uniref:hypothetical protein n=1 Tax=Pectobacterium carotovorum TaxID=554 RepID=UPI001E580928|nr:hypothetical protein [Pectobacterium carotovorum]UFT92954.1 hypothetical protein LQF52_13905 [Pectobacterium carotovorum]
MTQENHDLSAQSNTRDRAVGAKKNLGVLENNERLSIAASLTESINKKAEELGKKVFSRDIKIILTLAVAAETESCNVLSGSAVKT